MRAVEFRDDAPVVVRATAEIGTERDRVWEVLAAVERWPSWHRRIGFATLHGGLEAGTILHWACDGMKFSSLLTEVDAPSRLGWTLRTLGGRGYLRWTLLDLGDGRTRVRIEESWEGLLVRILGRTLRRTLTPSRSEWIRSLAVRCEPEG